MRAQQCSSKRVPFDFFGVIFFSKKARLKSGNSKKINSRKQELKQLDKNNPIKNLQRNLINPPVYHEALTLLLLSIHRQHARWCPGIVNTTRAAQLSVFIRVLLSAYRQKKRPAERSTRKYAQQAANISACLLYTSPSPRD